MSRPITREEAVTMAVRRWLHLLNLDHAKRDGDRHYLKKHRLFIRCVRNSFAEFITLTVYDVKTGT